MNDRETGGTRSTWWRPGRRHLPRGHLACACSRLDVTDASLRPGSRVRAARALRGRSRCATAALFATLCRINTLYMIARAGSGHIGSSFSSLDIVSWLHLHELRGLEGPEPADATCSSPPRGTTSRASTPCCIGLGRLPFETLHTLRRLGGLPGHPDVEHAGDRDQHRSARHGHLQGQGDGAGQRLAGREGRVFVLTGDGELQEGQFWESLATAAHAKMGEITAIVDHNKIQSDTWVSSVSDLGDLVAKFDARSAGMRCAATATTSPRSRRRSKPCAASRDRPKLIVADTVKGRGRVVHGAHRARAPTRSSTASTAARPTTRPTSARAAELIAAANAQLEALGAAPLALRANPAPGTGRPAGRRNAWWWPIRARCVAHAERDPRIVALDADLVLDTGLIPFSERFPDRFVECGIAEQDMVSQAGGLALAGTAAGGALVRLLSVHPAPTSRSTTTRPSGGRVVYVGLARRTAAGRPGPLPPVGARHRGAGGHAGTGDAGALLRGRGGAGGGVLPRGGPDELLSPPGLHPLPGAVPASRRTTGWSGGGAWR